MSQDRKIAKMTIILDVNPYSKEAMPIIQEINKTIDGTVKGTELHDAKTAIGGTTARNVDLKEVTGQDFLRTATIMLIGDCINRNYTLITKHNIYYWLITISVLRITRYKRTN